MINLFLGVADFVKKFFPYLKVRLLQANINKDDREYIASAIALFLLFFVFCSLILYIAFIMLGVKDYKAIFSVSLIFSFFIFMQKMIYPTVAAKRRIKNIERNLLPALQNIFVQVNSGIMLFEILVNVSKSDYGEVSREFAVAVKEINGGKPQMNALEDLAARNPSTFFRRAIWQIINGMKSGADISSVMEQIISLISEEQIIQIQSYGSKLSPLAMFYMLIGVIIPSLSITFIILFLSFLSVPEESSKMIFYVFYTFILFSQIMFIGLISSRRPNLL
jgi:flagellar protein FlaJ